MTRIRGFILDVDGTLLDSNHEHAETWRAALEWGGFPIPYDKVRKLIGMGTDHLLPELTGLSEESELGKKMTEKKDEFYKRVFPGIEPLPGARKMVEFLSERKMKLAIATSSGKSDLKKALAKIGIEDFIEGMTSADDAENSKPDPDLIQSALKKAGLQSGEALMIGDTPYDIEAAKRAGMDTIAFRSGGRTDADLRDAVAIFDGPADFLRELNRLLPR